jgi:hypothetical protein
MKWAPFMATSIKLQTLMMSRKKITFPGRNICSPFFSSEKAISLKSHATKQTMTQTYIFNILNKVSPD